MAEKKTENKKKKGSTGLKVAAGGLVAVSLFFSNMFSSSDELRSRDVRDIIEPEIAEEQLESGVQDTEVQGGLRARILSLPYGVRMFLIYPLWLMGTGITYLFSLLGSFFSTPAGGAVLKVLLTAVVSLVLFALTMKAVFPDMPLKKILSKKNVSAVLITSIALSVASGVLAVVWEGYSKWVPLIRACLLAVSISVPVIAIARRRKEKLAGRKAAA
ncbi:MAG: hypothetical protein ACOX6J_01175 [Oscillospiraceae bacterium]|jgi:hypothetical protein